MQIPASEFKANCLKIMDEVEKTHDPVIITKRGRPVAKLVSVEHPGAKRRPLFGYMAGEATLLGDVVNMPKLNNHRLKPVGLNYGLKVRIRVA